MSDDLARVITEGRERLAAAGVDPNSWGYKAAGDWFVTNGEALFAALSPSRPPLPGEVAEHAKAAMDTLSLWAANLAEIIARDYGAESELEALANKYGEGTGGTFQRLSAGIKRLAARGEPPGEVASLVKELESLSEVVRSIAGEHAPSVTKAINLIYRQTTEIERLAKSLAEAIPNGTRGDESTLCEYVCLHLDAILALAERPAATREEVLEEAARAVEALKSPDHGYLILHIAAKSCE